MRPQAGSSLIEIMSAIVILTVIALGTAASLSLSQSMTANQRLRRLAMDRANERLEEIRAAAYTNVDPLANNYSVYFINGIKGALQATTTNCGETFMLGGIPRPFTTTVQFFDADGGGTSYDCLRVNVSIQYGSAASATVVLETLESQY